MATPILKINGTDYAAYVKELSITLNDLDADGSGRNILSGKMYRSRIASKYTLNVTLIDKLKGSFIKELHSDLYSQTNYLSVSFYDPETNSSGSFTMYCSTVTYGTQLRVPGDSAIYYYGTSFELIER